MRVIDPNDVEPTVNPNSAEHRDGRQVHRRILSRLRDGPASIDIGYNRSAAGLDYAVPYAYNRDEFCYTAAGSARMESGGEVIDFAAGLFMWRPAGAATHRFTVTHAYNSICAFTPARVDAWGHLLPASHAALLDRPRPRFLNPDDVEPRADTDPGVQHRIIFDTPTLQFSHIVVDRGVNARLSHDDDDQVFLLDRGAAVVSQGAKTVRVEEGQFLFVPAGESFDGLQAEKDCVLICWSVRGE